jgi:hypothetical protein
VVVIEAPRFRRNVIVEHVAAAQLDRHLSGRKRRNSSSCQHDLDHNVNKEKEAAANGQPSP